MAGLCEQFRAIGEFDSVLYNLSRYSAWSYHAQSLVIVCVFRFHLYCRFFAICVTLFWRSVNKLDTVTQAFHRT